MIGIVTVDGTGTDTFVAPNNDQYRVDYANSHCSRIFREFPHTTSQRGPWLGVNVEHAQKALMDACRFIVERGLRPAVARMTGDPKQPGTHPHGGQPGTGPGNGNPGNGKPGNGGGGGNGKGTTHVVVKGESLSLIAGKHYGDVLLWPVIHDSNKQQIGTTPNLIQPGWKLTIPSVDGYSPGSTGRHPPARPCLVGRSKIT